MAIVLLATRSWVMVEHSNTGRNRAVMHVRDGNGRRVPKAPSVRIPGPARQADAGERRKAVAWHGVDGLGCERGIAAATWQNRGDDPATMEHASIYLRIRNGCGGTERVAARGTEQATGHARAKAPVVVGVSHPPARRGGEAARQGLDGSIHESTRFGNNALAVDPVSRRKRGGVLGSTGVVEVQGACRGLLPRKTGRTLLSADDYSYALAA